MKPMSPLFAKPLSVLSVVSSVRCERILYIGRESYRLSSKTECFLLPSPHANPIPSLGPYHMLIRHHSRCLLVGRLLLETRETSEDDQAREGTYSRETLIRCDRATLSKSGNILGKLTREKVSE